MNTENKNQFDPFLDDFFGSTEGIYKELTEDDMNTKSKNPDNQFWDELFESTGGVSVELTEDEWNDYAHFPREDRFTEKDYLIGYWDMGMFEEKIVRASNEELAIDGFLHDYRPKRGLPPYIARCETIRRAEGRVAAGYTALPKDGQYERYQDFCNAYYEALYN